MLFAFHVRKPKQIQSLVFESCKRGAMAHGDRVIEVEGYEGTIPEADGTIIVGIGGVPGTTSGARTVFDHYLAAGKRILFFDKGYTRDDRLRVSIDSFQPIRYLNWLTRPADRIKATGVQPKPYRGGGHNILFDGASGKYCQWYGLGKQLVWGAQMIRKIRKHTDLPIIYRPRPSHNSVPKFLPGNLNLNVIVSQIELPLDLDRAQIVVSHGGNLGWDAVVAGKPHFAIDVSIARTVSEVRWPRVGIPYIPTNEERYQWMCNVAYCQWRRKELLSGEAWATIREQLAMVPPTAKAAPCMVCGDHGMEQVYGGHGTVLELPCTCEAGIKYGVKHPHLAELARRVSPNADRDHDDGPGPVPDPSKG